MDSGQQEIKKRIIKVKTKKQLIVAVECCVGVYDVKTTINFGEAMYIFCFEEQKRDKIPVNATLSSRKYSERVYDKRLKQIISKIKKTKF